MKIRQGDFSALQLALKPFDTVELRNRYANGEIDRAHLVTDLNKRYRWDLLFLSRFNVNTLYAYLNDEHIDSALRRIVSKL